MTATKRTTTTLTMTIMTRTKMVMMMTSTTVAISMMKMMTTKKVMLDNVDDNNGDATLSSAVPEGW